MPEDRPLGITVLVTRPREQAAPLIEALEQAGADVVALPVIDIVARDRAAVAAEAASLAPADLTVFISTNAVRHGLDFATGRIAAIGPATAAAIEAAGRSVDVVPSTGYDSESLLAEADCTDVAGKRVRIVRGVGGREALKETLLARGAAVDYVEVYERQLSAHPGDELDALDRRWREGGIDVVVVMSVESFRNLKKLLPAARERLSDCLLVTPAARVIKEAQDSGADMSSVLARGPGASDMAEAIASAAKGRPGTP